MSYFVIELEHETTFSGTSARVTALVKSNNLEYREIIDARATGKLPSMNDCDRFNLKSW